MQRFLVVLLFVVSSFFVANDASALNVMEKTGGNLIGDPAITSAGNMAVIGYQSGKVKFVRNVKYVDSSQTVQAEYKQVKGARLGTAFTCPGYYYVRTYSDIAGTKLNGTIRLYIAASDLPNAAGNCAAITPPAATPVAPAAVKKINVTHPRPTVIETKNNIKVENIEAKIEQIQTNEQVFIQKDDPQKAEFVAPFPEPPPPPQTEGFLFLNPYYNPLSDQSFSQYFAPPWFYFDIEGYDNATFFMNNYDFSANYAMPAVVSNAAAAQGYGPFEVGTLNAAGYTPPLVLDQNLAGEACTNAGGMIFYKEQFDADSEAGVSQHTPICIAMQEYENCQIVRYFAAFKHHDWNERLDPDFSELDDPLLRNLLSFDLSYCQHNKLTNNTQPTDPFIEDEVERAAYTITECAAEDDYSCDELLPDPYFTPTAAPVDPGGGNVVEPVDPGSGGGSPRR